MSTKVNKSAKRRMNALMQIALIRAFNIHGYTRPEVAQCYKIKDDRAYFYFTSESGQEVGEGEFDESIPLEWTNELIINHLVTSIRIVTGYAEHQFRKQLRDSARIALATHPSDGRAILNTMVSFY